MQKEGTAFLSVLRESLAHFAVKKLFRRRLTAHLNPAAMRFLFPSTQNGYRATRNVGSDSWQTKPQNQANRVADKAKAHVESPDHEPQPIPPATPRSNDSPPTHSAKVRPIPNVLNQPPPKAPAARKESQRSARFQ